MKNTVCSQLSGWKRGGVDMIRKNQHNNKERHHNKDSCHLLSPGVCQTHILLKAATVLRSVREMLFLHYRGMIL